MKSCEACGTELADRAVFCTECGVALAPVRSSDPVGPPVTGEATTPWAVPSANPTPYSAPRKAGPPAAHADRPGGPPRTHVDRPDPPAGPETLPPGRSASAGGGPFDPSDHEPVARSDKSSESSGSSEHAAGSGRPATYAGVLVPPDPGPRRRRTGLAALAVLVVVALAGGAVLLAQAAGDDDTAGVPMVADLVADLPSLRPPAKTVAVGDEAKVRVTDGFAVVAVEADGPAEVRMAAPDAVVVVAPAGPKSGAADEGAESAVDATKGVSSLAAGSNRVVLVPTGERTEIELTTTEVMRKGLPANNLVELSLTEDVPVVDVAFSPGADHAWNLVDGGPAGIEAAVHDVTNASGVATGDVVCDLEEIACAITGGHDYVLRVTAAKPPVKVDLQFEDQPPTGGPGSVTFDGTEAPFGDEVAAGKSITYELVVGPPEGVNVTVAPIAIWDPDVKVDGKLVSSKGPVQPEVIAVDAGVRRTFTVGGGQVGGGYVVTVERR